MKNNLLLLLVLIFTIQISAGQQTKHDGMCANLSSVLCARDVMMTIATEAKSIEHLATQIQKYIFKQSPIIRKLDSFVSIEMKHIDSTLPISKFHVEFFQQVNINQTYLVKLFSEAHDAIGYYYNSIEDILNLHDVNSLTTKLLFRQIQTSLRMKMICEYRRILNVYSHNWPLINQINRIEFSERKHEYAPELVYHTHSFVITRLLNQWMRYIHSVINNLEFKLF